MHHDNFVQGVAFRLRAASVADAWFIDKLRQDSDLSRFLHSASPGVEAQESWLRDQMQRLDDFYFVVERVRDLEPVGLISLYEINRAIGEGEWGRWVVRPNSFCAIESVMLVLRFGFEEIGLQSLFCRTLLANRQVLSFHDSLGLEKVSILENYAVINGLAHDAIEHRLDFSRWESVSQTLLRMATRLAGRV